MGSVRVHPKKNTLFFDFRYQGKRRREYTSLTNNESNIKRLQRVLTKLERQIADGTFEYEATFKSVSTRPRQDHVDSSVAKDATSLDKAAAHGHARPCFREFVEHWVTEHSVEWRRSHLRTLRSTVDGHLLPWFGDQRVDQITRETVLAFRNNLAALPGRKPGSRLSSKRINSIVALLKQVLDAAAERHRFEIPGIGIKRLKVRRTDVQPFSLTEVQLLLDTVRADYRDYLLVRFFTGMRSGEADGLQWKYVDFERRLILIRETLVLGERDYTKTDGSQREIQMSNLVYAAMRRQEEATRTLSEYVFCNRQGNPVDNKNFVERVWRPLLNNLSLSLRRPYQMRHTAATLWLAAGENPEWVARQLGHTNTEMLFRVYSRYIPNLTRQDGSAIERLLQSTFSAVGEGV